MTTLPSLETAPWLADPALKQVFAALAAAGGVSRVAGGAVRNSLLGEPIADVDIATTLEPEAVMAAGLAAELSVHPTGLAHGTITLVADHRPFEVTTLRVDVKSDGRRASVAFTRDWVADAQRRDFTINALYCDAEGQVFDPIGGFPDLTRRRVRFAGDAEARITEDFLRILRFFRFHARYGRGAPDPVGLAACVRLKHGLAGLSAERVRQETLKLLVAPRAVSTLKVMLEVGILPLVLPKCETLALLRRMAAIDLAQGFAPDPLLRLAALSPDPLQLRHILRLTNREIARLHALARQQPPTPALRDHERRVVLYQLGVELWSDAVRMAWLHARARPADLHWRALHDLALTWQPPVLPVDGRDLIRQGVPAGPAIGAALRQLEDWWLASDFKPGRDELLARLPKET